MILIPKAVTNPQDPLFHNNHPHFSAAEISLEESIFSQIAHYYRQLLWIFRPIIYVILRDFFNIFRHFSALWSSTFSTFWNYNNCDFYFFSFFHGKRETMRIIALILPYYQLFFWLFWTIIVVFLIKKRGKCSKSLL